MPSLDRRRHPLLELMDSIPPTVLVAAVSLCAFLVRLLILNQIRADPHLSDIGGDGQAYLKWARTIAQGDWIGHEVFYPSPLYPYLVAVFYKLFGTRLETLLTFHAAIGAAGCGLLAAATRQLLDPLAGWIAGLMLAVYPAAISYDLQIDKTVLDPPLVALTLLCIAGALRKPSLRWWLASGVTFGIFSLTRENALALAVPIVAWLWWAFARETARRRLAFSATLLLGIFLAIFPVCLRNSLLGGGFYLSTAKFGANFYYGNAAPADGVYFPLRPGRGDLRYEQIDAVEIAEQAVGHPLTIGQVSHWWTQRTLQDIAAAPGHWAWLSINKFAMFFCDTEIADADVHERHIVFSPLLRWLDSLWGFRTVFMLAAGGTILLLHAPIEGAAHASLSLYAGRGQGRGPSSRHEPAVPLLLVIALTYAAAISVFILFGRYRLPIVPMLLPLAAGGLTQLPETLRRHAWKHLACALACAFAAAVLVWCGERCIPQRIAGTNPYNRANLFAANHQTALAIANYREAIRENPTLAAAYSNLSLQLAETGKLKEAEAAALRALELEPADAAAHTNLGLIFARQRRWPDAIAEFHEALQLDPAQSAAKENLIIAESFLAAPTTR